MIYASVKFPRNGIGNRLFPWARCLIFAKINNAAILGPNWTQIKIGTILRRERDKRFYYNLFKRNDEYIYGMKKLIMNYSLKKVQEPGLINVKLDFYPIKDQIYVFEGCKNYFEQLLGWEDFLHKELISVTREEWLNKVKEYNSIPIGIHVRLGDFKIPKSREDLLKGGGLRIPLGWFVECINLIRSTLGKQLKAYVFSDGKKEELLELLKLPDVQLIYTGSAISDLLTLSKSRILLASASSFSAWASFFGGMPTISHPGQSLTWFKLKSSNAQYIGEFDPKNPNSQFTEQIKLIFRGKDLTKFI